MSTMGKVVNFIGWAGERADSLMKGLVPIMERTCEPAYTWPKPVRMAYVLTWPLSFLVRILFVVVPGLIIVVYAVILSLGTLRFAPLFAWEFLSAFGKWLWGKFIHGFKTLRYTWRGVRPPTDI